MTRFPFAIALAAVSISMCGSANAQSPEVKTWLERNRFLNDWCRGDSGDLPTTNEACALRNLTQAELEKLNWCYGKKSEAGYQMRWHPCGPGSQRHH